MVRTPSGELPTRASHESAIEARIRDRHQIRASSRTSPRRFSIILQRSQYVDRWRHRAPRPPIKKGFLPDTIVRNRGSVHPIPREFERTRSGRITIVSDGTRCVTLGRFYRRIGSLWVATSSFGRQSEANRHSRECSNGPGSHCALFLSAAVGDTPCDRARGRLYFVANRSPTRPPFRGTHRWRPQSLALNPRPRSADGGGSRAASP